MEQLDPTVDETANELGSTPTPELGEKRPSKAEQMIAAFSARRAAAMAQVEAINGVRVGQSPEASAAPAIEVIDVALADDADMGPIKAPIQDPLIANAETSAPAPKLGGASASAGKARRIVHQSQA
ncbi:MAG: hypothetical protein U5N55_07335 [Cypionkella sp.]|nr:hypothetical protein [Cypionkella sp.]